MCRAHRYAEVWNNAPSLYEASYEECSCASTPLPCYGPWPFGSGYAASAGSAYPCIEESQAAFPGYTYLYPVVMVWLLVFGALGFTLCSGLHHDLVAPFLPDIMPDKAKKAAAAAVSPMTPRTAQFHKLEQDKMEEAGILEEA